MMPFSLTLCVCVCVYCTNYKIKAKLAEGLLKSLTGNQMLFIFSCCLGDTAVITATSISYIAAFADLTF